MTSALFTLFDDIVADDVRSSPSLNDAEAASQQLLTEASSPVRRQPAAIVGANLLNYARTLPKPPALAPTQAEKAGWQPKPGQLKSEKLKKPGKLPRTSLSSLVSESSQRRVRGERMYDIDPSPQKRRPRSLPTQVPAIEDDEEQAEESASTRENEDMLPETGQVQPEDGVPAELLDSEQAPAVDENLEGAGHVRNVSRPPMAPVHEEVSSATKKRRGRPPKLKSGESKASARLSGADVAVVQDEDEPSAPSIATRPKVHRQEDIPPPSAQPGNDESVLKKRRKLNGWRATDPDAAEFEDDLIVPRATVQQDARPRGDPQPQVRIPSRPTRSRTAQPEAELARAKDHSATAIPAAASELRKKPAPQPARTTRSTKPASAPAPSKRKPNGKTRASEHVVVGAEEADDEDIDEAPQATIEPAVDTESADDVRVDEASNAGAESDVHDNDDEVRDNRQDDHDDQQNGQQDDGRNDEQNKGVEEHEAQDGEAIVGDANTATSQTTNAHVHQFPALNKVFRFTESEERSGVCSTKLGRFIHRRCDRARVTLSQSGGDSSLDDTTRCKDDLVKLLGSIGVRVHEERRVVFKRDAFAYLFRALTMVLQAMHDKLQEREGEITESLGAMQIVYPYIRKMLSFKDTIDSWKVTVQQRTQGDRLIKNVESGLIAPLRDVEKRFRIHFRHLQRAGQSRQALVEIRREREEEEQELIKREEALRSGRERRKRWQDLHIVRMQCEPDPARRRTLRFVEPVQGGETDANGRPFERVPFFGERSAPPPQWSAASSGREWTKEQETVLLDALQSSAGKPDLSITLACSPLTMRCTDLERIFRRHCGPGGALRDFSVSDFVAKMAWVRSGWTQLSHLHGWDIPEWVKKMPVLP